MNIISSQVERRDGVEVQARPEVDNEQPTSISRSSRQVDEDITSDAHIKSDIEADAQVQAKSKNGSNIKTLTDSREVVVEQTTSQDTSHTSISLKDCHDDIHLLSSTTLYSIATIVDNKLP